ncbi:hypothetical protein OOK31_28655 [Streptomyces sp. NBC_00249]|uniref:hypothetical protein n=1 Tax=Streptomyces sp. NBC_00249 TaxID=2975690 RepID=UPI002251BCF1|nr:hypothetical protein [Streptomyces sp. NBC_00249]MCX5197815.1 hypothetical protein [Streptomyces sp. NBC_00249]
MLDTSQGEPTAPAPVAEAPVSRAPLTPEGRGCLFALSQPPLMIFLAVIGTLLLLAAVHDLYLL